jgi:hypothetical protein
MRDDPFKNFDRNFNIMRRFTLTFIAVVFTIVISGFIFVGYQIVTKGPEGIARDTGRLLGAAEQGYESARPANSE